MSRMARIAIQAPAVPAVTVAFLLAGLLVGTGGCANTNNREEDTRGASLLVLDALVGGQSDEQQQGAGVIFSDVCDNLPGQGANVCSIVNDNAIATFRNLPLNTSEDQSESYYQDITLYRYHVIYTRSDGNNVEGVDVPFSFDSVVTGTVEVNGTEDIGVIVVRHTAKVERPLVDLRGIGDEEVLSTNTRMDFYGRDLAGNEHQVFGWIDIEFADYGEKSSE